MIAYVYVVDTPWFGKTGKDGRVRIEGLPAGEYEFHTRHPLQAAAAKSQPLRLKADEAAVATVSIAIRPQRTPASAK